MGTDKMTYMANRGTRILFAAVITTILVVGICGEAAAQQGSSSPSTLSITA
jgi:hypothetical protein